MRALVITAAGVNLKTLHKALAGAGTEDIWVLGSHVGDRMLDECQPAFVVGVLSGTPEQIATHGGQGDDTANVPGFANADVMLRVGRLVERGFSALVVAPPPLPVPAPAADVAAAPCPIDDAKALALHLWAFVSALSARAKRGRPPTAVTPRVPAGTVEDPSEAIRHLKRMLRQSADAGARTMASFEIERLVMEVLQRAGADVAESREQRAPDAGYDLAVVLSKGAKDIFLVEVVAGHLDRRRLRDRVLRLQRAMAGLDNAFGMLVYQDDDGRRFEVGVPSSVIAISAEDLLDRLQRQSLTEVVDEEVATAARRQ